MGEVNNVGDEQFGKKMRKEKEKGTEKGQNKRQLACQSRANTPGEKRKGQTAIRRQGKWVNREEREGGRMGN